MTGPTVEMPADTKSEPSTDGPLIVACLRISDLRPAVDPLNGAVTRDRLGVGLSPADAAGLEHALRIADAWSGRVVAVCVGPASVDPVLREVAALGVAVVRVPLGDEGDGHRYVAELAEAADVLLAYFAKHGYLHDEPPGTPDAPDATTSDAPGGDPR